MGFWDRRSSLEFNAEHFVYVSWACLGSSGCLCWRSIESIVTLGVLVVGQLPWRSWCRTSVLLVGVGLESIGLPRPDIIPSRPIATVRPPSGVRVRALAIVPSSDELSAHVRHIESG